jgi:monofunctional glycosyltransferase
MRRRRGSWIRRFILTIVALTVIVIGFFSLALLLLRWIDPVITTVQIQRFIEAMGIKYQRQYKPVDLKKISVDLQHAVIAAEDGRFYDHHGIDFTELAKVVDEDLEEGRMGRGASTITQQLIKNLFLTTHRNYIRKGLEFVLAPLAELILPKQRILELYLNVIEWGPGVYGAEAAARYHYGVSAAALNRDQAARLAAIVPSPVRRKPSRMNDYSVNIQTRMRQMGW